MLPPNSTTRLLATADQSSAALGAALVSGGIPQRWPTRIRPAPRPTASPPSGRAFSWQASRRDVRLPVHHPT